MIMTRKEMEDIWENKPHGYFKQHRKNIKKMHRYKVKLKPYVYTWYDTEELEILAKNIDDSYDEAKQIITKKYKDKNIDGFRLMGSHKCV